MPDRVCVSVCLLAAFNGCGTSNNARIRLMTIPRDAVPITACQHRGLFASGRHICLKADDLERRLFLMKTALLPPIS